jgi:hypothetical protein
MKARIEKQLSEIGALMKGHLSKSDYESVTRLSTLLSRLQLLQKRATELDGEISEIEATIKGLNGKAIPQNVAEIVPRLAHTNGDSEDYGRAGPQTLRIEVDWKANGKTHEKEVILLPKAGDGMVKFLSRVIEEFGQDVLQKLSRIKINRGLLLSKTPSTDFLNQAQGKVYAHKRLHGTDFYVLTHSQTSQKMDDISRICRVIGFVPGSVQVRTVSRADCYSEIYG